MSLRLAALLGVGFFLMASPMFVALWRVRDGMAAWKRSMAAGAYAVLSSTTLLELTDATAISLSSRLVFALDMFAALVALVGIFFCARSWRMRRRSGESAATE